MAAPGVAIGRLATRVRAPDPEAGYAAGRLVDAAVQRLGPALDAALPRALAAAGLAEDAVLAIPHLALRLRIEGEATAGELSAAWAEALARAIAAAAPAARRATRGRADGEPDIAADAAADAPAQPALFATLWAAQAALLLAAARGEAPPWWALAAGADLARPGAAAALLLGWVGRDAARAAAMMAAALEAAPDVALLLAPREADGLARALLAALGQALAAPPAGTNFAAPGTPAALAPLLASLPAQGRAALGALPAALRAPWAAALLMARAPGFAAQLPALLPALAALPAEAWRRAAAPSPPAAPPAARPKQPDAAPLTSEVLATEVLGGGLLLLLRPLAALAPGWLTLGEALPPRLLGLGLLALQRLAAPLPPAARRAALERDRMLLTVFAGAAPPDAPLDEVAAATPEIEAVLARLLAAMPPGVAHAPGALRRAYGRDPFGADPATDALCRLVLRPGRLRWDAAMAELVWPPEAADIALRRAGWDIDPGWLPWIGRRIGFRYGAEDGA
jgi:hypothetical protein